MPTYYVDSAATGANDGTSWTDAKTTLSALIASLVAGDTIYIASAHTEGATGLLNLTFPGTITNPNILISAQRGQTSPHVYESMATGGGKVNTTVNSFLLEGGTRVYGVTFECNTISAVIRHNSNMSVCHDCVFTTTSQNATVLSTNNNFMRGIFHNCTFTTAENAGTAYQVSGVNNQLEFYGCTFNAASLGAAADDVLLLNAMDQQVICEACDFSNSGSGKDFVVNGVGSSLILRGCKMPSSWTANLGTDDFSKLLLLEGSDGGANPSAASPGLRHQGNLSGIITHETTEVRTGGANDGDTDYSWKYAPSASVGYHVPLFNRIPLTVWHDATGSKTLTVFVSSSDSALTDKDVWMDVESPAEGTASYKMKRSTTRGNPFSTTALTSDSSTWTTGGNTKYKMTATLNPVEPGPVIVRVNVAKDADVFVDPELSLA